MRKRSANSAATVEQTKVLLVEIRKLNSTGVANTDPRVNQLKSKIIKLNTPLAVNAARNYQDAVPATVADVDDLISIALTGISKAIDTFDPSRGVRFSTHCCVCMRRVMSHYRRDHLPIPRRWIEIRDSVRSRQRLWKKTTGQDVSEVRIVTLSMGLQAQAWTDIEFAFTQAFNPLRLSEEMVNVKNT